MLPLINQVLKGNNLSKTLSRKKLLGLFLKANSALVHAEIEKELHTIIDRVTIYRTLKIFLSKGIIHLTPTIDNSIKYALTKKVKKINTSTIIMYIFSALPAIKHFASMTS